MFYPGDKSQLQEQLEAFVKPSETRKKVLAAVSPHAGYTYSGGVAGAVFSQIDIPESVVLLGPNHRGIGAQVALDRSESWDMPMGAIPVNESLASLIIEKGGGRVENDPQAHAMEHSIEVQVPFLQALQPKLSIVPISVSHITFPDCEKVGSTLAAALGEYGKEVLLVASTDMTHYESQNKAHVKDQMAIDRILDLDPAGLFNTVAENRISMCGVIPTTIVLAACQALGATKSELVQYATSGDVTGDYGQVVGYAGFLIY
jgi:AmmeMemoRadiSam system protein B